MQEEVKEWDECLLMLGDNDVDEEGNVLVTDDQDTELLDRSVEDREINVSLVFCDCLSSAFCVDIIYIVVLSCLPFR